jgi:hypothetical protein
VEETGENKKKLIFVQFRGAVENTWNGQYEQREPYVSGAAVRV